MAIQNLFFVLLYGQFLGGCLASLIFEAKSAEKFARASFFCGSSILDLWVYLVLVVNKWKINDILDEMEEFIEQSE